MAKYMFEITVSNSVRNQTQNVPGKFGTATGTSFVGAVGNAGILCVRNGLIPCEGYESFGIKNGNTWYFNVATSGVVAGFGGDETGIYAINNYDVNKATSGDNAWNLGARTLGLEVPADERATFTQLLVNEQYTFGADNFSAVPGTGEIYATVSSTGKWTPASTVASLTAGTVYAEILRTKPVNEGTSYWGDGYVLQIKRA